MLHWNIELTDKNIYLLTSKSNPSVYVKIKVTSTLGDDYAVNIDRYDISEDGIVFIPNPYPTPDDDMRKVIGECLLYEDKVCVQRGLVDAEVIDTNYPGADVNDSKTMTEVNGMIEVLFA